MQVLLTRSISGLKAADDEDLRAHLEELVR